MSLISWIKSMLGQPEFEETPVEEPESERTKPLPVYNRKFPVEVQSGGGDTLFTGRLSSFNHAELIIERLPGEISFPILEAGTAVLVRGYDMQMRPFTLRAVVSVSSVTACILTELDVLPYDNSRKSNRFPLRLAASIYDLEDKQLSDPQKCQLINISVGGACIASAYTYELGQLIRLRVELVENEGYTSYPSKIIRMSSRKDGLYEYGLLFAQLSRSKMNELERSIQTIQTELERLVSS